MSYQQSFPGFDSAISSPASEDGLTRSGSQDGPTTVPFGRDRALASLSARQALDEGLMTRDTYGRTGDGLSTSVDLQSSLESRLQARLAGRGSPEYKLTWKHWDMPRRAPICALRASVLRTSGSASGGWQTPKVADADGGQTSRGGNRKHELRLGGQAKVAAGWATPTSRDYKDGEYCPNVPENALLGRQVWTAGYPAETEKSGALNPALSRWLMGYPDAWDSCGVTAMQSFRKSRKRS